MNYLKRKYMALMRGVNFRGYIKTASGYPITLNDCIAGKPLNVSVSGNTGGVGDKTVNLFDISQLSGSNITVEDDKVYMKAYANTTNITPEMFLAMTGLKAGDKFTTNRQFENVDGVPTQSATGKICFLNKSGGTFYINNATVTQRTIPDDFTNDNYHKMYIYGISNHPTIMSQIQVVSGSYTSATLPEYEPYDGPGEYKIPVVFGEHSFLINLDEPLNETDEIRLDIKNQSAMLIQGETITDVSGQIKWDNIPDLPDGTALIKTDTTVEPSEMSITYYANRKE